MAKNTIVMWGSGRNSEDTKRKLRIYDDYRRAPFNSAKRNKLYADTVTFGFPLREIDPQTGRTRYESLNTFKATHEYYHPKSNRSTSDIRYQNAYREDLNTILKKEYLNNKYANSESPYDKLFDYEPYVDFAILGSSHRPSTFEQCVSFFYPLTLGEDAIPSQSPLRSTSPVSYDIMYEELGTSEVVHKNEWKRKIHRPVSKLFDSRMYGQIFYPNTHPTHHGSTVPLDLGEATMMYAWFTIYKLLLCPRLYAGIQLPKPENLFADSTDKTIRYGRNEIRATENLTNEVRKAFAHYRKVLAKSVSVAQNVAENPDFSFESVVDKLESEMDNLAEYALKKGMTYFSKMMRETLGISSKSANLMIGIATGEIASPKQLESPDIDFTAISTEVVNKLNSIAENAGVKLNRLSSDDKNFLKSAILFGDKLDSHDSAIIRRPTTNLVVKSWGKLLKNTNVQNLSPETKKLYNQIIQEQKLYKDRMKTYAFSDLKRNLTSLRARSNPAMTVALQATGAAFNSYMGFREKELINSIKRLSNYYTTRQSRLRLDLGEDGVEFILDTDANLDGVKAGQTLGTKTGFSDREWELKPYCGPVNGKFFKAYVMEAYRQMEPIIAKVKTHFNVTDTMEGFDLIGELKRESGNSLTVPEFINQSQKSQFLNITNHCRTFDIFEQSKVPIKSTRWVLWDLPSFSPFTQAFGWEPTFLTKDPTLTSANGIREISGAMDIPSSVHTWRNKDIGIFGSAYNKGKTFMDVANGGYFSPGRGKTYSRVTNYTTNRWNTGPHGYWKTSSLQTSKNHRNQAGFGSDNKGRHRKTVNSQRKLSSALPNGTAGFTDLNFDVATGVPIFNAQWVAATSVIFCYAEALKNLADMGYGWAAKLYREKPKMAQMDDATFEALKAFLPGSSKNFSALSKSIQSGKKPLTFMPKPLFSAALMAKNRGGAKTASDDENTPFVFKPKKVEDKSLTDEQDVNKLAIQLGVSTISVGMLAILALKLRKM